MNKHSTRRRRGTRILVLAAICVVVLLCSLGYRSYMLRTIIEYDPNDVYLVVDDSDAEFRSVFCLYGSSMLFRRVEFPGRHWKSELLLKEMSDDVRAELGRVFEANGEREYPPFGPHENVFSITRFSAIDGKRTDIYYQRNSNLFRLLRRVLDEQIFQGTQVRSVPEGTPFVDQVRLFLDMDD